MRRVVVSCGLGLSLAIPLLHVACASAPEKKPEPQSQPAEVKVDPNAAAAAFVAATVELYKPLELSTNLTWYQASVSGSDEDWAKSTRAQDAMNRFLADPAQFAKIKALRDDAGVTDPLTKRQLEVLYLGTLGKQVAPELLSKITELQSQVEQAFNGYRGKVGGKEVTQNETNEILRTATDSKKLKEAWEAQKAVGPLVAPKLKELVKLRNEVAKQLGFRDFYALRIAESEQNEEQLLKLFDDLDALTAKPFAAAKAEVDKRLAKRLKVKAADLMPWHYQNAFFQEPPDVFNTGLDAAYKKQDTLKLCKDFYTGIGLNIDDIIARSDLYERKGKTPHAFETSIDRGDDVRVLANIVPGYEWQSTMVHELGHAAYDKFLAKDLPWMLRSAAHPLTTEGYAMMMDALVGNPRWAAAMGIIDQKAMEKALPEAKLQGAFAPLQFSRWTQVMLRFERAMYADPEADLGELWWSLVEKYQGLKRPAGRKAPDFAAKIHVVVAPVYYHNYMLGELFGSQVHEAIAAVQGKPTAEAVYVGDPKVGEFMQQKLFAPGARLPWHALAKEITGKELSPEAFAKEFAQ